MTNSKFRQCLAARYVGTSSYVGIVSSSKRRRAAGDGRRHSHAGVHGDRSDGHRMRRRSSRIESRSRKAHQRRVQLDINRYFAFCHSHWTVCRPLVGSSFIPTPASLVAKRALINVYNPDDNMCFVWAILSALYPCKENAERISKYRPYLKSINLTGLKYPIPVNQIARFEKNNPTISINVYILGKDGLEIIPKFVTKCRSVTPFVGNRRQFPLHLDQKYEYTWFSAERRIMD
jgi:hypothetical protein